MTVRILTEDELRQLVPMDLVALASIEEAFTWLHAGKTSMPPVMHIEVDEQSDVDIKSAYVAGLDSFAVKVASGFFGNVAQGLPSASGMVVLLSAKTGFCEAVFLDNGYLTDLRTGLAGAVAAKHLAREQISTVGILGAGGQARYQLESLSLVRSFERVLVAGRDQSNLTQYAEEMRGKLGVEVVICDSAEQVVRGSDVIVTTTQSKRPIVEVEWLRPGTHITAMGADLPGKQELASEILQRADVLVCDSVAQCHVGGELQHRTGPKQRQTDGVIELGAITSGSHPGRSSESQITVCDLTGTGVQDTAIARVAYDCALKACGGLEVG